MAPPGHALEAEGVAGEGTQAGQGRFQLLVPRVMRKIAPQCGSGQATSVSVVIQSLSSAGSFVKVLANLSGI